MGEESYMIKKILRSNVGKKTHVLMTDGQSQVLEFTDKSITTHFICILNENTDNGCEYEIIIVKNRKYD